MSDLATTHRAQQPSRGPTGIRQTGKETTQHPHDETARKLRKQSYLSNPSPGPSTQSKNYIVPQAKQQELRVRELKTRVIAVRLTEAEYDMLAREADELAVGTLAWQIIRKHYGLRATILEGKKGRK